MCIFSFLLLNSRLKGSGCATQVVQKSPKLPYFTSQAVHMEEPSTAVQLLYPVIDSSLLERTVKSTVSPEMSDRYTHSTIDNRPKLNDCKKLQIFLPALSVTHMGFCQFSVLNGRLAIQICRAEEMEIF
jgi:hypothetical protein